MTIEDQLRDLILSKYHSLREFTIAHELPYTTVYSLLKRGVSSANVTTVLAVCNALNISQDALAKGEIKFIKNDNTLNQKPRDIADILADTKKQLLAYDGLMFNGKPADPEAVESILNAMEVGMELAKRKNLK